MAMKLWRSASYQNHHDPVAPFGRSFSKQRKYEAFVAVEAVKPRSTKMQTFFTNLRRKFQKEKHKVFSCAAPPPPQDHYNLYTYAQNFEDEESRLEEPENLSRSFSARFAGRSSKMFVS